MPLNDLDKTYTVQVCQSCEHPGGRHIINAGCRLCDCAGWVPGHRARWSDRLTQAAHSGRSTDE